MKLKTILLMLKFLAAAAAIVTVLYLGYLWADLDARDDYGVNIYHPGIQVTATLTAQETGDER